MVALPELSEDGTNFIYAPPWSSRVWEFPLEFEMLVLGGAFSRSQVKHAGFPRPGPEVRAEPSTAIEVHGDGTPRGTLLFVKHARGALSNAGIIRRLSKPGRPVNQKGSVAAVYRYDANPGHECWRFLACAVDPEGYHDSPTRSALMRFRGDARDVVMAVLARISVIGASGLEGVRAVRQFAVSFTRTEPTWERLDDPRTWSEIAKNARRVEAIKGSRFDQIIVDDMLDDEDD